jgi:membrane protease YdiL (CAAX protease family)
VRIRRTGSKIAYIAIMAVFSFLVSVGTAKLPEPYNPILGILALLALFLGAARAFRGSGEAMEPARAWWQMTSRPTAGFVVGGWLAYSAAIGIFVIVSHTIRTDFASCADAGIYVALAALYFNSSIRLLRHPPERVAGVEPLKETQPSGS